VKNPFKRSQPDDGELGEMTLLGHLTELRKRLIRSVATIIVAAIVVFIFRDGLLHFLEQPYCDFLLERTEVDECRFLITNPLQPLSVALTLSGYGGLILALPVVLYQIGRFVMPGLYPHEKRMLIPFIVASILLLALGMISAYLLMPKALSVLQNFGIESFTPLYTPGEYIGFFVKMLFAFGFAAEFPLILVFLQMVGVVRPDTLASNRRMAVVAVVILGAVITPTGDPFMLAVVSVPMYVSYEIAIIIGRRLTRHRLADGPASTGLVG
jgi:sec-independent protein translocase protein TatC